MGLAPLVVAALAFGPQESSPKKEAAEPFKTLRVGVVIHDGVEMLDFAGPIEVFDAAASQMQIDGKPLFQTFTIAPKKGICVANGNVRLEPNHSIADEPAVDVVVIPGGATQRLTGDPAFLNWVRKVAPKTKVMLSVCTGAFVLAKTGLLDGAEATTWHGAIDALKHEAPKAKVLPGRRVVDNGRIVTAGGVSCGIDGALHVVARIAGRKLAQSVADYMDFRWQPEPQLEGSYLDYCTIGGDRTELLQQLRSARRSEDWKEVELLARELIDLDPEDGLAWYELGHALIALERFDEAIDACQEASRFADRRPTALYNLACAWARKGDKEQALGALGRAVDAGYAQRDWTEKDEDLASLRGEERFIALLERMGAAGR